MTATTTPTLEMRVEILEDLVPRIVRALTAIEAPFAALEANMGEVKQRPTKLEADMAMVKRTTTKTHDVVMRGVSQLLGA